jgi:Relaxase/Mobilisation nuclease domain
MVARIIKGKDIGGLVKYHEKEKSSVLYSQYINDAREPEELTVKDKVEALQAYIGLNPAVAKPTFHVSLNPDPQDKLSDDQLQAIGREYMEAMNYGQQPYLIYKHEDIDRVHIHIVSVNIGIDGKVINSSHERYRSEAVRKQLEVKYQLVKAGDKTRKDRQVLVPIEVAAIAYGKTDTKSAIARVVGFVLRDFAFSSMPEFRALLNFYHVTVDEVKDSQEPGKTIGLCYAVINEKGEKVSARIKASALGQGMGYEALLKKFAQGKGSERKKDPGSHTKN